MIERGCNLDVTTENGLYPAQIIAKSSSKNSAIDVMKALVKRGAKIDIISNEYPSLLWMSKTEEMTNYLVENKLVNLDH